MKWYVYFVLCLSSCWPDALPAEEPKYLISESELRTYETLQTELNGLKEMLSGRWLIPKPDYERLTSELSESRKSAVILKSETESLRTSLSGSIMDASTARKSLESANREISSLKKYQTAYEKEAESETASLRHEIRDLEADKRSLEEKRWFWLKWALISSGILIIAIGLRILVRFFGSKLSFLSKFISSL